MRLIRPPERRLGGASAGHRGEDGSEIGGMTMRDRFWLGLTTLDGTSVYAQARSRGRWQGSEVALFDQHGRELVAIPDDRLAAVGRILEFTDPARPGQSLALGPIDVARLKALRTPL